MTYFKQSAKISGHTVFADFIFADEGVFIFYIVYKHYRYIQYNDKAIIVSTEDEHSCTENKSVATHRHYSAHSLCRAHSAFTYHRGHYSLLVYQDCEVEQ